jgi:hypothetical protein
MEEHPERHSVSPSSTFLRLHVSRESRSSLSFRVIPVLMRTDGARDDTTDTSHRRVCTTCGDQVLPELMTAMCPCGQADICPPCLLMAWMRERADSRPGEPNVDPGMGDGRSAWGSTVARQPPFSRDDLAELAQFAADVADRHDGDRHAALQDGAIRENSAYWMRTWVDEDYDEALQEEYWASYRENQQLYATQVLMMLQAERAVDEDPQDQHAEGGNSDPHMEPGNAHGKKDHPVDLVGDDN